MRAYSVRAGEGSRARPRKVSQSAGFPPGALAPALRPVRNRSGHQRDVGLFMPGSKTAPPTAGHQGPHPGWGIRAVHGIAKLREQGVKFVPRGAARAAQRLGPRIERLGRCPVRDEDLVPVQHEMVIAARSDVAGDLDSVQSQQMLGRHQNLVGAEHPLRDPGPDQDAVLRRHQKIALRHRLAKRSPADPHRPQRRSPCQPFSRSAGISTDSTSRNGMAP